MPCHAAHPLTMLKRQRQRQLPRLSRGFAVGRYCAGTGIRRRPDTHRAALRHERNVIKPGSPAALAMCGLRALAVAAATRRHGEATYQSHPCSQPNSPAATQHRN